MEEMKKDIKAIKDLDKLIKKSDELLSKIEK
jgi:hypothetical protein